MRAMRVMVVMTVLVTAVVRAVRRRNRQRRIDLTDDLLYRVPVGQDPAAVVAKLSVNGFAATSQRRQGDEIVVIPYDPASGRQRVRELIASTALNMEDDGTQGGPVEFIDERPHGLN